MDCNNLVNTLLSDKIPEADRFKKASLLRRAYPYFPWPSALLAMDQTAPFASLHSRSLAMAVALTASPAYYRLKLSQREILELRDAYPPEAPNPSLTTDQAIDAFLQTYGTESPEETSLLEKLLFNPVPPDYAATLEMRNDMQNPESDTDRRQMELIDSFIAKHPSQERLSQPEANPVAPVEHTRTPDDQNISFAESLARIYIKQHQYDRATEIIRQLCLNNPEKSCYFADQLRFLNKLIAINSVKSNNQQI